jgi:copper chaperone CopZ
VVKKIETDLVRPVKPMIGRLEKIGNISKNKDRPRSWTLEGDFMKTTLKIEGMSCEHCVRHVTGALEGLPGVKKALVSLKEGTAVVDHEEAVGLEAMKFAVDEAGYEVV